MITVKTVSVTYERKINLGDYNSATVGCTLWADLEVEEGAGMDDAMHQLWAAAKENVKAQVEPLVVKNNGNMKRQDYFLGLPSEEIGDAQ